MAKDGRFGFERKQHLRRALIVNESGTSPDFSICSSNFIASSTRADGFAFAHAVIRLLNVISSATSPDFSICSSNFIASSLSLIHI